MEEVPMKGDDFIEGTPRKADVLFAPDSALWHLDAVLDYSPGNDYTYRQGYRRAGRLLTEWVAENGRDQDFLVFPICHAYRHFVELILKTLIPIGCSVAGREMTEEESRLQSGSHNLNDLWQTFKKISAEVEAANRMAAPAKDDIEGVEAYIDQLHAVDKGSYAFRYPHTRTGAVSLEGLDRINLGRFCEQMERLCNYLEGYEMYYRDLRNMRHESQNAYAQEYGADEEYGTEIGFGE